MEVVFGVFSPSHDSYQKVGLISAQHRLEMCQAMVQDSDWLEVSRLLIINFVNL